MSENPQPIMVSQQDYDIAMLYDAMIDRHSKAPDEWGLPMMAVRLLCKRVSFDALLKGLELRGVPWTAERCRHELVVRQEFFARMIVDMAPEDRPDIEAAAEEMAHDLAAFDSPPAVMNLLKFLDRLLKRERTLQLGTSKTSH